jgi:hypothetical protein
MAMSDPPLAKQGDAHGAVLGPLDAPHETPGDGEKQQEGNERAAGEERELQLHAEQCAEYGRHHRQREQRIRVAQDAILLGSNTAGGGLRETGDLLHGFPASLKNDVGYDWRKP